MMLLFKSVFSNADLIFSAEEFGRYSGSPMSIFLGWFMEFLTFLVIDELCVIVLLLGGLI